MKFNSSGVTPTHAKTNEVIPYSSVFIELDCKYWSPEKEKTLRHAMKNN